MSGLAVTCDHYQIVGLTQPKGLLIFDLHAGGPPLEFNWPDNVEFAPYDLAPAPMAELGFSTARTSATGG